jgi:hypothetical protein
VDLITGYVSRQATDLAEQGHMFRGIAWELTVPYCDFAGQQRTAARLQIVCRGDDIAGPWLVEHVEQESPGGQRRLEPPRDDARQEPPPDQARRDDQPPPADSAPPSDTDAERSEPRRQAVTDLWGAPTSSRRRRR